MSAISNYPRFDISNDDLIECYRFLSIGIHDKSSEDMCKALRWSLKVDPKAEQSIICDAFLKYYLRDKWETIKAKYQLKAT